MHVKLVDHTINPEEIIGRYAAICYDSQADPASCVRRAKQCVNKGHLATLRFAYATFLIEGISRACSHQLVRSKHLDYLQESQRYVLQDTWEWVTPESCKRDNNFVYWMQKAQEVYQDMIRAGIRKEDARYVLPNATTTRLYVTGNFQAWKDFINLRSGPEVQWEIRQVAQEIERQLSLIAPNIFELGETSVT